MLPGPRRAGCRWASKVVVVVVVVVDRIAEEMRSGAWTEQALLR
jgi:hypothetical protein